jgi:hypothetical protein
MDPYFFFFSMTLAGGDWPASLPRRFTLGWRNPKFPLDRRLGGLQNLSGWPGEEKILDPTMTRALTSRLSALYPVNIPRPIGLWDVETPTFSRQSAHRWQWGCQPAFLVLISIRGWVNLRTIVWLERLDQLKNPEALSGIEPAMF